MYDFFLKFVDEQQARAVLFSEGADGATARYDAIDLIGVISRPTGQSLQSAEGSVPQFEQLPGFHVNVRHRAPAPELQRYEVQPTRPARAWF